MSSVYAPTPVELGDFTIPDDGDVVDASSVSVAFGALGDGVAFCQEGLEEITPRGWFVGASQASLATTFNSSSASFVNVTGLTLSRSCVAGDILVIDASLVLSGTTDVATTIIMDEPEPTGSADVSQTSYFATTGVKTPSRSFIHVVTTPGTVTVRVQAKGTGAFAIYGLDSTEDVASTIRIVHFRPGS